VGGERFVLSSRKFGGFLQGRFGNLKETVRGLWVVVSGFGGALILRERRLRFPSCTTGIGQKSSSHSNETWTDPEELSQRRVIWLAWFAFDIFLPASISAVG
jgi:hypothetical protein